MMKAKRSEYLEALLGSTFFLLILLPIFVIWIPRIILLSPDRICHIDVGPVRYLGLLPIALGVAVYLSCVFSFVCSGKGSPIPFTPTEKLIITGFYRYIRNPMYVAGVFLLAGEALLFQSIGLLLYCLIMFGVFNVHVIMEEKILADTFGADYKRYRDSVPRWIPRWKPYRENE